MIGYKVLQAGGKSPMGSGKWVKDKPRVVRGELSACRNGIHYCTKDQLVNWLNYGLEIWLFRDLTPDETIDNGDKMVTRKGVIVERFVRWDDRTARLFAADCADKALRMQRKRQTVDPRSTAAVKAARDFADGKIGPTELAAAGDAAWAAAWDAAWATAWAAAWDAAGAAAGDAAWAAAWDAAWDAERRWQTKRLFDYLEGRRG